MTVTTSRFQDTRDAIRLTLPDLPGHGIDHPNLAAAVTRYNHLASEYARAQDEHERLVNARPDVVQADRRSLAGALAAGKPDPGPKSVQAHDAAIAGAARKVDALAIALGTAADNVAAILEDGRADITALVDAELAAVRDDQAAAVEAWAEARAHRARLAALRQWCQDWPAHVRYPTGGPGRIAGLVGVNHDPMAFEQVAVALREDAG